VHAYILLPIKLFKKSFLLHGTQKLCSKFSEDRSINYVTILSTDNGQTDMSSNSIFCALHLKHWFGQFIHEL